MCGFCEHYEHDKQIDKIADNLEKGHGRTLHHEYTVAIVNRVWFETKKLSAKSIEYRHKGFGFKLNYCPECGKPLRRTTKRTKEPRKEP